MHIEEVELPGGHIQIVNVGEKCPKCGREMTNIMLFGEVCIFCDSPTTEVKEDDNICG